MAQALNVQQADFELLWNPSLASESTSCPEAEDPGETPRNLSSRVDLAIADLAEATSLIVRNHYLHRGRTMAQMPYWVLLDGERVGVILYAYPRLSVKFQGFHPMELAELARMWLDPKVQGLRVVDSKGREHAFAVATCAVANSLRRIRTDWHGKYPHLPDVLAVVSWADQEHHEGTIYRASNFVEIGTSGGTLHGSRLRPNGGHDQLNPDYRHLKTSFLYRFSRVLTRAQRERAVADWAPLRRSGYRVKPYELTKAQRRLPVDLNTVIGDVCP